MNKIFIPLKWESCYLNGTFISFYFFSNEQDIIWTKKSWQTADETNYNTMRMKGERQNSQLKLEHLIVLW